MASDKHYREARFDGVRAVETKVCPTCNLTLSSSISICPNDGTVLLQEPRSTLGERLSNQYEIISEIASGGMGVIFKARHLALDSFVAIKMLLATQLDDGKVKRFRQEAAALSKLDHPCIVHVRDFGFTENGQPYMVLDFIDGQSLSNLIKQKGAVPPSEFVPIFSQVCQAIEHAHNQGILHRDLKPGNIMLVDDVNLPVVKIVDFGIAKLLDPDSDKGLTKTGEVFGSPQYMSPEQASGSKIDQRSDIYSLGCVMYEALTGVPPFTGDTAMDVIFKQLNDEPVRPSKRAPDRKISKDLEDIVIKALRKSPGDRFQSVAELSNALTKTERGKTEKLIAAAQGAAESGKLTKTMITGLAVLMVAGSVVIFSNILHGAQQPPTIAPTVKPPAEFQPMVDDERLRQFIRTGLRSEKFKSAEMKDSVMDEFDKYGGITKDIDLSNSAINGEGLAHLIHLPLYVLNLTESSLTDRGMQEIALMSHLGALILDQTNITDKGLKHIQTLQGVGWLSIQQIPLITDEGLAAVAQMKGLGELSLGDLPRITAKGISHIVTLPHLRGIGLQHDKISIEMVSALRRCKTLQNVAFSDTDITDEALAALGGAPELKNLNLEGCQSLTRTGLATAASFPKLTTLGLEDCKWLQDQDLEILRLCSHLAGLNLNDDAISDQGVVALEKLPLELLNMDRTQIADKGLMILATIKTLKRLSIAECSKITAHGIASFKRARPDCQLEYSRNESFMETLKEDAVEETKQNPKPWK